MHYHHGSKLLNLTDSRSDIIQALGDVEDILSHSVFNTTGYSTWEGNLWKNLIGHEERLKYRKTTNFQRIGLSQVPNG
jgi:hypothetical protein